MRVDLQIPVLLLNVFLAALLQDLLPAVQWLPVKICFLTSVALHAAAFKPFRIAFLAALLAGSVTDALGGLPMPCTACFLLVMVWLTKLLKRTFLTPKRAYGILFVAAAAALQGIWTRLWLGSGAPLAFGPWLARWVYLFLSGAIAGGVGFAWCSLADRLAGLVKPVKEDNEILWQDTDR